MHRFSRALRAAAGVLAICLAPHATAVASAPTPDPVYRGRAIFEPVDPPVVPLEFHGRWVRAETGCERAGRADAAMIEGRSVTLSAARHMVRRVLLRPGQEPPARDAILELGTAQSETAVLIASRTSDGKLRLRMRGSDVPHIYRRCATRPPG